MRFQFCFSGKHCEPNYSTELPQQNSRRTDLDARLRSRLRRRPTHRPNPTERPSCGLEFPVDRAKAEDLQRWVNEGHDQWCRDPQLVAASALRRVSSDSSEFEPTSLQLESNEKNKAVYTFHSLDGYTTYRITLRRYRFLLRTAGSFQRIIWIPETAEILSRATSH